MARVPKSEDEFITDVYRTESIINQRPLVETTNNTPTISPADFLWLNVARTNEPIHETLEAKKSVISKC